MHPIGLFIRTTKQLARILYSHRIPSDYRIKNA